MTEKALAKTHSKIEACQKLPISMKKHTQKAKEPLTLEVVGGEENE